MEEKEFLTVLTSEIVFFSCLPAREFIQHFIRWIGRDPRSIEDQSTKVPILNEHVQSQLKLSTLILTFITANKNVTAHV